MSSRQSRTQKLLETLRGGGTLTGGQEFELVARLAVPSVLAQISFILMQYTDAAMVGHLGANGSAAVGLVSTSLWFLFGLGGSSIMGFSVQTAHRIGAREYDEAKSLVRQAITTVFIFGSMLAALGVAVHTELPHWLGGDPSIAEDASLYFFINAFFLPATFFCWLGSALLRASGDMKTPSMLGILMCVTNVIFNWFLIFPTREMEILGITMTMPGADLGVAGAAWGTVIAEGLSAVLMFSQLIFRSPELRLIGTRGSFIPKLPVLRRAVTIAAPVAAERVMMTGAQIVSTMIVAPLGIFSIAAHTLAITAESVCYMPGYGIGDAASTLVGQSVGARRPDLARRIAWKCVGVGMTVMTAMGVFLFICAPMLMGLMTEVPEVIELGTQVLRIEAFAEPMFAAAIVCYQSFIGTGDTLIPAIFNLSTMWLVRISLAWILAPIWGLAGVWTAMCTELIVRGSLFLIRMKSGAWLKKVEQRVRNEAAKPAAEEASEAKPA
ncbi:MATE family efflux transporter [Sutterella sp.]|uniref:MATE family efflux transporter n=1 Tax=Sutterella sp. TaxID=1981025 RepID=UPI0026DEF572|nr:MATE family efflux transporter [Sutterella sp.]MDO5532563.1 MATE family efflux transporter [Sutterella sp.]